MCMDRTRRSTLAALASLGGVGTAGCLDGSLIGSVGDDGESGGSEGSGGSDGMDADQPAGSESDRPAESDADTDATGTDRPAPPTADTSRHVPYEAEFLMDESLNGGVGKDGIPSIDDPSFEPIADAAIADEEPVFGVVRDGEAKAYPQYVLVYHEIVNDTLAGDPVSVTYCPLTGTAQGFERGGTEFGVSGDLVNSNLIMYDRETDGRWPQVLATGIDGPKTGKTLREFRVVWTTLAEWRAAHPDSGLLTEDTGYAKPYGGDPYGDYAPIRGYYATERTMFPSLESPAEGNRKSVVLGARTADGAVAFDKETLLADRVLTGSIGGDGTSVVAVADPALSTGYVYRNPDELDVEPDGDAYRVDGHGGGFEAAALPLDRVLAFDAMWFAWAGFYPDTGFVGGHTDAGYGR